MRDRWTLTVNSDARQLARIGEFIIQAGNAAGLNDRALFAVELACDEACSNVIEHGYAGQPGEIRISCFVSETDFIVEVVDRGPPFNPLSVKPAPAATSIDDIPVGGRGITLIRKLMDSVAYAFDPYEGNRLTMTKRGVVPAPRAADLA